MTVTCAACAADVDVDSSVRFRKDGFDIVRCPACGLLFRATMPAPAELDAIYDASYFFSAEGDTHGQGYSDYLAEEELHRESARRRLEVLERHVPRGTLLDVGTAAGFFVDEARRRGWVARGIDIAPAMVDAARERGFEVTRASIADVDGEYDVVTMWDYIEHSVDALGDVRRAAELLRPGGLLALSTGDAASVVARASGARWHLLTPRHHNYFFTPSTLRRLLDRAGLDVVAVGHPGARYSLRYLTYKLRTLADVSPVRAVAAGVERSPLGAIRIPLNLGDIVTVHATRR